MSQHIFRVGLRCSSQHVTAMRNVCLVGTSVKLPSMVQLQQQPNRSKGTKSFWGNMFGYKFMDLFDDRSKIIVVDGNIGCGKSALAKDLADKLGMRHMKEATIHYFDEKELGEGKKYDDKFMGYVSLERFYADPFAKDGHSFRFQLAMYAVRFIQYTDALQHLLETGQGVVMERSVYSDSVFMEAMYKMGYFRKECHDYYHETKNISLYRLKHPHLIIYLDAPVNEIQAKIKDRGLVHESSIPDEYLQHIEDEYKHKFLPAMSETSEVLTYDWKTYGNVDKVVEDVELLKYAHLPWNDANDDTYDKLYRYVRNKTMVGRSMWMPKYLPEITFGADQFYELTRDFEENHSKGKGFSPEYNPDQPLRKLFFK